VAPLDDFARSYTDAWCSGDPTRVAAHYAPEGTVAINGAAPTPILDVAESFMAAFPDMELVLDEVATRPDGVVEYHWTLIGDHAETGKHVHISGFEQWTLGDDGLVAASLGTFDATEYERQVAHGVGAAG
jgi:hypothetical protein